jgi:hypothetical protein
LILVNDASVIHRIDIMSVFILWADMVLTCHDSITVILSAIVILKVRGLRVINTLQTICLLARFLHSPFSAPVSSHDMTGWIARE